MVLEGYSGKLSKFCCVRQRFILVAMGCIAIINAYTTRVCISMAITEMVPEFNQTDVPGACPEENTTTAKKTKTKHEKTFDWSETQQGLILSSFFYGYILSHLPAGVLSEKYGAKHVLGTGALVSAILTIVTPPVIFATDGSVPILIVLRILIGIGQGPTYPALNAVLAQWIPKGERSLCGAIVFSGAQIGTIISNLGSGAMIAITNKWELPFYVFGAIGIVWWLLWCLLCYSTPDYSPFLSEKEATFLHHELDANVDHTRKKTPWKAILTSVPVWALVCVQWGHDWGWFMMATDLPKYMHDVLKFNIKQNAVWSSLPYFLMWLMAILTGLFCDWLITKNYIGITAARKLFSATGNIGPGVFLMVAVYVQCAKYVAVAMFTIGMGLMGTYYSGMKVNALDLSPNFSGTLMALNNGLGCIAGMIAPLLVGVVVKQHSFGEWGIVFWVTFAILGVSTVFYVIFASGEVQPWNHHEEEAAHTEE